MPRSPYTRIGLDVPVETKFHAPKSRPEWVERPDLAGHLASAEATLVLVDAPAGFGKTTLVAQWRSSSAERRPFAWISLDRADNDPGRLWWHVVCALQRACPGFDGEDILGALRVQLPDVTGVVLPLLANELAALPAPVVLVLDDYHVIRERACHEQVEFLLTHLPPQARLVLITRVDPPLPLARLRVAGEMVEIRARELRFAPREAARLVHAVSRIQLNEPDLALLMERTEGWPTGVYLAALSLRDHPSPHTFVRQFTGDNRFIVEFLGEEVLSRQPAQIRQFLARTSILGRFCASLCDAVTGVGGAAEIIEVLERENLFIVPLDDDRQWYRYHHLFAHMLRSQLARTEPDIASTLHGRASAWHRLHGSISEAVGHAIAGGDLALPTDLIASHWLDYVNSGQTATVDGWLRSLGDDQIAANPVAAHCAAWAAALSGSRQTARHWLPVIDAGGDEGPLPDGIRSLRSSAALLRGTYGFDGVRVMRESAATAVKLETDSAAPWYALAKAALGYSLYLSGEAKAAEQPLEQALRNPACLPLTRIVALSTLSLIAVDAGRLPEASGLMEAARDLARRDEFRHTPSASLAHIAAGAVRAAQGRLDEARGELEHALHVRRKISGTSPWPTVEAILLLAQVLLDMGDRAGARELANQARDVLTALPDGAQVPQARLGRLDRRIAAPLRKASPAEPLTDREVAVLYLLTGTLSLREIGQELFVSANTIKTHTQAIYRKLGVSTRHDAVDQAKRQGILR